MKKNSIQNFQFVIIQIKNRHYSLFTNCKNEY